MAEASNLHGSTAAANAAAPSNPATAAPAVAHPNSAATAHAAPHPSPATTAPHPAPGSAADRRMLTSVPAEIIEVTPTPAPSRQVTIAAVGDVLFGRYVAPHKYRPVLPSDAVAPFADVAPIVRRADVALANVECPITTEPQSKAAYGRLTFRAEPDAARILAAAGFDVVSFANNHALNFGTAGIRDSLRYAGAANLNVVGVGDTQARADAPLVIEKNGLRLAVLARTVWLNGRQPPTRGAFIAYAANRSLRVEMAAAVRDARQRSGADFLIVFIHWGMEYAPHPAPHQRHAARAMIDAGADVIIGHHPHVIQDVTRYRNGLIVYSLGNFLFDNPELRQRRTVVFTALLDGTGAEQRVRDITLHPVIIDRKTRLPRLARGRSYRAWKRDLAALAPEATIAAEPPP